MAISKPPADTLFVSPTPLGFSVRVTRRQWQRIVEIKHPAMAEREDAVREAVVNPVEVRQSQRAPDVYLCYKQERPGRWICAVVRRVNGDGFLVTAYVTDAIKEGVRIWPK